MGGQLGGRGIEEFGCAFVKSTTGPGPNAGHQFRLLLLAAARHSSHPDNAARHADACGALSRMGREERPIVLGS